MDNITHALVGMVEGQVATRLLARRELGRAQKLRPMLWALGAVANNLPDIDSFTLAWLTPGRLGRVLHHRGYTHTVGGVPFEAALILLGLLAWLALPSRRHLTLSRREWVFAGALTVIGLLSHLGADSLNSYGVHPWWPVTARWYYGDSLFILEPCFWVLLSPFLFFEAGSLWLRATLALVFTAGVGLCLTTGYVPWLPALALAALGAATWGVAARLRPDARVAAAMAACAAVGSMFVAVEHVARAEVAARLASLFPGSRVLDLVLSPFPADPLCWGVTTVETEGDWYVSRHGTFAPLPRLLGASECPAMASLRGQAADPGLFNPVAAPSGAELAWSVEFRGRIAELRELARDDCSSRALLRFLRVPTWRRSEAGGPVVLSDGRFGRMARSRDFQIETQAGSEPCPPHVPDWGFPRADLLGYD